MHSAPVLAQKPVSIIVSTRNGLHYTQACLDSIRSRTAFGNYSLIVADNGSADGFAKTINRAIAECDPASDIILLHNDTEILQPDWIDRLQRAAYSAPNIGIVGCRLVGPDGALRHAGTYISLDTWQAHPLGAGEKDINQFAADRDVEGIVFACAYLKREALQAVGPLDEDYFSYLEDTDYCFKVKDCGYRVVCCGAVTLIHHENRVPQSNTFYTAQQVFRQKWEATLPAQKYTRKIGWHSLFNFPTGYAISSRELAMALDRNGVHVAYKYVYGPGSIFPPDEPAMSESPLIDMIRSRRLDSHRPQVVYGQGDAFQSNFGPYQIGFTMLETDRIPVEWARQANLMDEVWCPSQFNVKTFRDSGVFKPIYVIPLGVDPGYFNPHIRSTRVSDRYTFLSVFEWTERKGAEILLRAFNEEFKVDEPAILVCKILNPDPTVDVYRLVGNLALNPAGGRIHVSLNHVVPTYQLGVLYRSADCFVLPTRGEGFGMPIMEAMACGLPVIATDWSAQCDFMNSANAYPLAVHRLIPAVAKSPYYTGVRWAEPSYSDLRRLMRHVYSNPGEARAKGERASHEILSHWTWDHAAKKIIARLDDIAALASSVTTQYRP